MKHLLKKFLPAPLYNGLRTAKQKYGHAIPVGLVRFGSLRRLQPVSPKFGYDRGQCIDRYYIEGFLKKYESDIQGRVLEVADRKYTQKFGGARVTRSDVLHATTGNPDATVIGDLTKPETLPANAFDSVVLTQTLHLLFDVATAVRTVFHILKPGGVVLATLPGISQISRYDMDRWGDCWRFTTRSAAQLFGAVFPTEAVTVKTHGNVLVAMGFLQGLASEELKREELDHVDPDYQVLITVRAVKPGRAAP